MLGYLRGTPDMTPDAVRDLETIQEPGLTETQTLPNTVPPMRWVTVNGQVMQCVSVGGQTLDAIFRHSWRANRHN